MRERSRVRSSRSVGLLLAAVLATALPLAGAERGEDLCDPELERESDSPMAYGPREDRCEGLYRLKVNSDKLLVRSWTAWFEDFDPTDPRPLELGWSVPPGAGGPVLVRAYALKPRTFYRMDTRLPAAEAPWAWSTRLLGQLRLGRSELGILGWTELESAGEEGRVYLPLTVRQSAAAEAAGYRVALVPGERLVELSWRVLPVLDGGGADRAAAAPQPLGFGYYPAGIPTVFDVPAPGAAGLYVLALQAELRTGGTATRELWFYHPAGASAPPAGAAGGAP